MVTSRQLHSPLRTAVRAKIPPPRFTWVTVRFWPFSAGHGQEAYWSNTMQMVGQVKCKRVVKSVQLPINDARNSKQITVDLTIVSTLMLSVR